MCKQPDHSMEQFCQYRGLRHHGPGLRTAPGQQTGCVERFSSSSSKPTVARPTYRPADLLRGLILTQILLEG